MHNMNFFKKSSPIIQMPKVYITDEVIKKTKDLLLSYSKQGEYHEGIAYWVGKNTSQGVFILGALTPKAQTTYGSVRVGIVENAQVVSQINKMDLQLVAQIHSHPFRCGVGHSEGDDHMIFMPFEGLISIVVKDYALNGLFPLTKTGVHLFYEGEFVRLSDQQVDTFFKIIPNHIDLR
jgi:hypothetical protein